MNYAKKHSFYVIIALVDMDIHVYDNKEMKGQSEIAYLPKFANMYILLIVLVIVITE